MYQILRERFGIMPGLYRGWGFLDCAGVLVDIALLSDHMQTECLLGYNRYGSRFAKLIQASRFDLHRHWECIVLVSIGHFLFVSGYSDSESGGRCIYSIGHIQLRWVVLAQLKIEIGMTENRRRTRE